MRTRLACLFSALFLAAPGCGPGETPDAGIDGGDRDVPIELFDAGPPCETDAECNDGVPCTLDSCDTGRSVCRHVLDNAMCDDGNFCNGDEACDGLRGCVEGPRRSCDDGDVCTVNACDEEARVCASAPRDLDHDGDADFFCTGGGDCDDRNPQRSSLAPEICADSLDNDCDGSVDEPDCGAPEHDTCDDALDVSAGGAFVLDTRGAVADYGLACAFDNRGDLALRLTIPAGGGPRGVRITADADAFSVALSLRTACVDGASEIECANSFPSEIRVRSLDEGTYYILVAGVFGAGEIFVNVELTDPLPPPPNETCASPIDVSAGGTFTGSFVDVADDTTAGCSFGSSPDLFYSLHLDASADVRITASSPDADVSWSIRESCAVPASDLRCSYGSPAAGTLHQLDAGDYFIVLEGPSYTEVDFTLNVEILPASPALPGDTCATPIPLVPGVTYSGSLAGMEHDYEVSCGFHYREAVHVFTLDRAQDVTLDVDGGASAYLNVAIRPTCDSEAAQLRCDSGAPARAHIRALPAGTYYVIVEGLSSPAYTIDLTLAPASMPVPVTGNDNCLSAVLVPETGGVYTGNTFTALPDYATSTSTCGFMARSKDVAFRLDLTTTRRVTATTDGSSFDTVLYYLIGACPGLEAACDDNSGEGTRSLLETTLGPGTYYFIVDGWGSDSAGDYVFELTTAAP